MTGPTSTVSSQIHAQLRADILGGRYAPGEALPSERRLCEAFDASRHGVREALKRLQQAGLVAISQGGATRVRDWRHHGGLELLLEGEVRAGGARRAAGGDGDARVHRRRRRAPCARARRRGAAGADHGTGRAARRGRGPRRPQRALRGAVGPDRRRRGQHRLPARADDAGRAPADRLGRRATRSPPSCVDADAVRALAGAIAAGDADAAHERARELLERSIPLAEVLYYAIPFFVLLLIAEYASFRHLDHDDDDLVGYDLKDTGTSLSMGIGNVVINVGWKLVVVAIYAALYELTPLRLDPHNPLTWVLLFFADDLAYYWFHRVSHESRFFWASHVVHHSSQHFNLSTALRQTWVPMTYFPFWLPLPLLGFPVWMVLLAQAWSLIYQFWIHTERIQRLPRWVEGIFNTPSHHRVHHGMNHQYLDKNYAGILIIWDRLFGTWEPEGERVQYGLTKQLDDVPPGPGRVPRVHRARARRPPHARAQDQGRGAAARPRLDASTARHSAARRIRVTAFLRSAETSGTRRLVSSSERVIERRHACKGELLHARWSGAQCDVVHVAGVVVFGQRQLCSCRALTVADFGQEQLVADLDVVARAEPLVSSCSGVGVRPLMTTWRRGG